MHVLIADDNRDSAESLAMLMEVWGFHPVMAYEGDSASELLRTLEGPTIALLDWIMPKKDGIELCHEIRQDTTRPYTYVILLTGRGGKDIMVDGLNAGADDFLLKPVEPAELHARLNVGRRILALQEQLLQTQHRLREQASRDSLTGLWNRATILETLDRELNRNHREGTPLAVMLADIDHFKAINDTHGHLAGDRVLRLTAQRMADALRPYDIVGRYGGEEFLFVLPGCSEADLLPLAQRICRRLESETIQYDDSTIVATVSLGAASSNREATAKKLLEAADNALYEAKRQGRNRAVLASLLVASS